MVSRTSSTQSGSFRRSLSVRLNRFRRRLGHSSVDSRATSTQSSDEVQSAIGNVSSQPADSCSQPSNQVGVVASALTANRDAVSRDTTPRDENVPMATANRNHSADTSTVNPSSDLWSAAYREAVDSLSAETDVAILMGKNAAELFKTLDEIEKGTEQESAFLRGVKYLRSIQVPLERFKLALDLGVPIATLDPMVATPVLGVVRSVTAIAISLATADLEFARQIGEMIEHISYIDDCDTLGQRSNKSDIHKALVSVYQKILEFYIAAHNILTKRGAKLVMKMVLETDTLPQIIEEFLKCAEILRKLIEKATWEVVEDIKSMLYDSEISRWLDSGRMNRQCQYHASLQQLRTDDAFEFLLTNSLFIDWYRAPDSQQLAILGEMGSGKTVTMAFLVDELNRRSEHQIPRPKVCYYYCRDDESGQAVQILSTLTLSLLEQLSGLKKSFYEWYKENQAAGIIQPTTSTTKLGEFLESILKTLDRPLFLVIDGLDECDRVSRKTLLESLENLSQRSPRVKIVFSSRPQEEILAQLEGATKIDMSSDVHRDTIIARHTVETQLSCWSPEVKTLVIETLSRLAQGSAIWTKMTVELIGIRNIKALGPMRRFLEQISLPAQLSDLYVTLLQRSSSNDPENLDLAVFALKILAVSVRPLSILELAWAVTLAANEVATVAALAELVDHQRVMNLIYPFISRINFSDTKKRQVQLVHQSVREFIVREWSRLQSSTKTPSQADSCQKPQTLEAFILDICVDYLLLEEINTTHLFSEEQIAIDNLPDEFDIYNDSDLSEYDVTCTWDVWEENMARYDPTERGFGEFFVYAGSHWHKHFAAVDTEPLPSLAKIESLCEAGSIRLDNWTNQNCRPNCTIKARFDFDAQLYDPLSITALYGSDAMFRKLLEGSTFDKEKYLPNSAMAAVDQIMQWGDYLSWEPGDLTRVKMTFLADKLGHRLRNLEFFQLVIRHWEEHGSRYNNWDVIFELVDSVLDELVQEKWGRELICVAARAGCMSIIQRLLSAARKKEELETELLRGVESIAKAVLGNHVDVVECLLKEQRFEAHLQFRNSRGENVLHLACKHCNPEIFRLLLSRFQEGIQQTNNEGDTPLIRIIKTRPTTPADRSECAKIILSYLANANRGTQLGEGDQADPLQVAVQHGDTEMCRLLLCEGKMNPLSSLKRNDDGEFVMKKTPSMNGEIILQLLRQHAGEVTVPEPLESTMARDKAGVSTFEELTGDCTV